MNMRYPEIHKYITTLMDRAGIMTNMDLHRKVEGHMGHEFLRLIVNGQKLPDTGNVKAIAKALGADFTEFLCVVENSRLRDRGLGEVIKVVPFSTKK